MIRTLALVATVVSLEPLAARAQDHGDEARSSLSSIDSESTAATVLYVTGTILGGLGAGSAAIGLAVGPGESGFGGLAYFLVGGLSASLGIVTTLVAIGLDVDSASRRSGWRRRYTEGPRVAPLVAPSTSGLVLGLSGSF